MGTRTEDVVRRLSERAEEVCRRYLPNGRRVGNYWIVGDKYNAKGRSLYLRLKGPPSGRGAAGRWTDGSSGEFGDLLDIIASAIRSQRHWDAIEEAERFLGTPHRLPPPDKDGRTSAGAAARLFAAAGPVAGTLAARYLAARGLNPNVASDSLRFHPRCYWRSPDRPERSAMPALLAAVRDNDGRITGVMRTYLQRDDMGDVAVMSRRAMGILAGNGVRLGPHADIMAIGEGVETMLSLRTALPNMSVVAALSAAHLAAFDPPPIARRLYVAIDQDDAGRNAAHHLQRRLQTRSINVIHLTSQRNDFNDELIAEGSDTMHARIIDQLADEDRAHFLSCERHKASA